MTRGRTIDRFHRLIIVWVVFFDHWFVEIIIDYIANKISACHCIFITIFASNLMFIHNIKHCLHWLPFCKCDIEGLASVFFVNAYIHYKHLSQIQTGPLHLLPIPVPLIGCTMNKAFSRIVFDTKRCTSTHLPHTKMADSGRKVVFKMRFLLIYAVMDYQIASTLWWK